MLNYCVLGDADNVFAFCYKLQHSFQYAQEFCPAIFSGVVIIITSMCSDLCCLILANAFQNGMCSDELALSITVSIGNLLSRWCMYVVYI